MYLALNNRFHKSISNAKKRKSEKKAVSFDCRNKKRFIFASIIMVNTTQENPKTTSFVKAGHPYVTWLSEAVDLEKQYHKRP